MSEKSGTATFQRRSAERTKQQLQEMSPRKKSRLNRSGVSASLWLVCVYLTIALLAIFYTARDSQFPGYGPLLWITVTSYAGLFSFMVLTHVTDPGVLQPGTFKPDSDKQAEEAPLGTAPTQKLVASCVIDGRKVHLSWCKICKTWRGPRCVHCDACGYCVQNLDHHCGWTGNCIATGNMRWFILMNMFLCFSGLSSAVSGILRISYCDCWGDSASVVGMVGILAFLFCPCLPPCTGATFFGCGGMGFCGLAASECCAPEIHWHQDDKKRPVGMMAKPQTLKERVTGYFWFNLARLCCAACRCRPPPGPPLPLQRLQGEVVSPAPTHAATPSALRKTLPLPSSDDGGEEDEVAQKSSYAVAESMVL